MSRYDLSIVLPFLGRAASAPVFRNTPPNDAVHVVHVFTLETQATIQQIKAEADKLAQQILPGRGYVALYVENSPSPALALAGAAS